MFVLNKYKNLTLESSGIRNRMDGGFSKAMPNNYSER